MVLLDKQGKLFGRINVFNFLAVLVLAGLVFLMIKNKPSLFNARNVHCTVVLKVEGASETYYPDYLNTGKYVWDQRSGFKLGEIKKILNTPTGEGKSDLTLTIQGEGRYQTNKELLLGNRALYLDQILPLKTDLCRFKARVIAVDWPGRT